MSAVKEINATNEFILLDEEVRKCQDSENVQECETKKYLDNAMNTCNCTPYHLIDAANDVSIVLFSFLKQERSLTDIIIKLKPSFNPK